MSQQEKEFREVYEAHYNALCGISYRIVADKDTAREVVQEVFIEIWRKQNWRELRSVQAYLVTAVYNRSLKVLKRNKNLVSFEGIKESGSTESHLEQRELEWVIHRAIDRLPGRCKKIFILSREDEMTYSQIAFHLGISIKTVEAQMGIALKKLRNYLQKYGI